MTVLDFLGLGDSGVVQGQSLGQDEYDPKLTDDLLTNQAGVSTSSAEPGLDPDEIFITVNGSVNRTGAGYAKVTRDSEDDLVANFEFDQQFLDGTKFYLDIVGETTSSRIPATNVRLDSDGDIRIKVAPPPVQKPDFSDWFEVVTAPTNATNDWYSGKFAFNQGHGWSVFLAGAWQPVALPIGQGWADSFIAVFK